MVSEAVLKRATGVAFAARREAERRFRRAFTDRGCLAGKCEVASRLLYQRLHDAGIKANLVAGAYVGVSVEDELNDLIEAGELRTPEEAMSWLDDAGWDHVWVELEDRTILDVTADQYLSEAGESRQPIAIVRLADKEQHKRYIRDPAATMARAPGGLLARRPTHLGVHVRRHRRRR